MVPTIKICCATKRIYIYVWSQEQYLIFDVLQISPAPVITNTTSESSGQSDRIQFYFDLQATWIGNSLKVIQILQLWLWRGGMPSSQVLSVPRCFLPGAEQQCKGCQISLGKTPVVLSELMRQLQCHLRAVSRTPTFLATGRCLLSAGQWKAGSSPRAVMEAWISPLSPQALSESSLLPETRDCLPCRCVRNTQEPKGRPHCLFHLIVACAIAKEQVLFLLESLLWFTRGNQSLNQ